MLEGGPNPIWISIFEEEELELVEKIKKENEYE
jgi:hypothetical protein